jgi:uncharacterized membrane protein YgcG
MRFGARGSLVGRRVAQALAGAGTVVVLVAAASETVVALGVVDPGWDMRGVRVFIAACVLLVAGPVLASAAFADAADEVWPPVSALALTTAAFVVARYFSYDSYYLPTLRRMSEGGLVAGWWVGRPGGARGGGCSGVSAGGGAGGRPHVPGRADRPCRGPRALTARSQPRSPAACKDGVRRGFSRRAN